jgi:hypothetical protein
MDNNNRNMALALLNSSLSSSLSSSSSPEDEIGQMAFELLAASFR